MATIQDASLSELATELERAEIALAIGLSRKAEREWRAYRKAVQAEIDRRDPVDPATAAMTDDDLLRALQA